MRKFFSRVLFAAAATFSVSVAIFAAPADVQRATKDALSFMRSTYDATYAPTMWKQEYADWNLEREYSNAINKVEQKGAELSVLDARNILMDFIYSMRDYHVSIRFISTAKSTLPLTIRSAEGRYFIVHIDKAKLSDAAFPFNVGDEVVSFADKPTDEVVAELRSQITENVATTDQGLAEFKLTTRNFSRGVLAPQGPVTLGVKAKGSEEISYRQLVWEYTPEEVPALPSPREAIEIPLGSRIAKKPIIPSKLMSAAVDVDVENNHGMGAKKSFLPTLGEVVWEAEESEAYQAYIYRTEENRLIGVIRIPSYVVPGDKEERYADAIKSFSKIVNKMEKLTDQLVIDQLNNPGGSVFYLYALASILSPKPLQAPRHTMSITPVEVNECASTLKQLEKVSTDEQAKAAVGDNIHGYPVTMQFVEFFRGYCRTILEDWGLGRTMTRPFWIAGVDKVNPYPAGTYSKPITVLVNELDFSGGDFFPTILQDNKRAKIFGVRTAGAGGYVNEFQFPNLLGVDLFRVTQSLAHRVSQDPIENLGVVPDVVYEVTAEDRQNNYADYLKAVKAAIE